MTPVWTLVNLIDLVAGPRDQVKIWSVGLSSGSSSKWAGQPIVPLAYLVNRIVFTLCPGLALFIASMSRMRALGIGFLGWFIRVVHWAIPIAAVTTVP